VGGHRSKDKEAIYSVLGSKSLALADLKEPRQNCTGPLLDDWNEKQAAKQATKNETPQKAKPLRQLSITPATSAQGTPQSGT
jgi:hypothetical protein